MASGQHLSHLEEHKIEGSNIELFGTEVEKRVREHAGDTEPAWQAAGTNVGLDIWRIEKFQVVTWPKERYGTFYSGDSYIVLHTYKPDPESEKLAYNLHFWLGEETTQDEMGTAAYKTVELDDHLGGAPVQYREVEDNESPQFLSYFPRFTTLRGGVATGFHHVVDPPPLDLFKLYHIVSTEDSNSIITREVSPKAPLLYGDVYILDKGTSIFQFNMTGSTGKERFKAAEIVRSITDSRGGSKCPVTVSEQSGGAGAFLNALGISADSLPTSPPPPPPAPELFRISDANSQHPTFSTVPPSRSSLDSSDAFILHTYAPPAVFVWIGRNASSTERKTALHYGERFLTQAGSQYKSSLIRLVEGQETSVFNAALAN